MEKTVMLDSLCIVLCSAPSHEVATSIANTLVDEHLAACVTIIDGATSVYRWNGEQIMEHESQMILKTCAGMVTKLQQRITSLHTYSVPEFLVIPVAADDGRYAEWVRSEVKQ